MRSKILFLLVLYLHCNSEGVRGNIVYPKLTLSLHNAQDNIKDAEDLAALLKDVKDIDIPGSPGFLSIYGSAFPVISGSMGTDPNIVFHPVVAGGRLGKGKLLGTTHDSFFIPEDTQNKVSDKNQFILNSIQWAGSSSSSENEIIKPKLVDHVAILVNSNSEDQALVDLLLKNGISSKRITFQSLQDPVQLAEYAVVLTGRFFQKDKAPILKKFVENGGGLIMSLTSWAYYFYIDVHGHFGENFPGNIVTSDSGFVWRGDSGDSMANPTTSEGKYSSDTKLLKGTHVLEGWEKVKEYLITGELNSDQSLLQFSSILEYGLEVIPPKNPFWQETNFYDDALNFTKVDKQPIPSEAKPIVDLFDKFVLQIFHGLSNGVLNPEDIRAHPSSEIFPGKVILENSILEGNPKSEVSINIRAKKPSWFYSEDLSLRTSSGPWSFVPRSINTCSNDSDALNQIVREELHVDAQEVIEVSNKFPLWFSTGLYAPPGEVIKVTIKSEDDEDLYDFSVQVGTHTDDISRHPGWYRMPRIISRKNFEENEAVIASPYGGLLYVLIPEDEISEEERVFEVTVTGAVKAPLYKLGETSIKEWRDTVRHYGGPWTEFVTDKIILSVPSSSIRTMDDPEDLLLFWDQVMDAIADLAAIPRERYRQERMVPDVQISAGFMHSGYPIMTFLKEGDLAVNVTTLRTEGSWGHFHELGHNHQQGDWTFDGTGEVTCNLFALYVLNTVCGIPTEKTREQMTPEWYRGAVSDYIVGGQKYEDWKNNPFLALMFYVQLQREYGWVAFKQVFAEYHKLEKHPGNDQEKRDLWLVMFSTVVKEDLSFFFESWGIPTSADASGSIANLPEARIRIFDLLQD